MPELLKQIASAETRAAILRNATNSAEIGQFAAIKDHRFAPCYSAFEGVPSHGKGQMSFRRREFIAALGRSI